MSHHHWSPAPGTQRLPQFLLPSSQYTEKQRFREEAGWAELENPSHRCVLNKQKHIYESSRNYGFLVRNVFWPQNHKQLSTNATKALWRVMTVRTLAWGWKNKPPGNGKQNARGLPLMFANVTWVCWQSMSLWLLPAQSLAQLQKLCSLCIAFEIFS